MKKILFNSALIVILISCEKQEPNPVTNVTTVNTTTVNVPQTSIEVTCNKKNGNGASTTYTPMPGVAVQLFKSITDLNTGNAYNSGTSDSKGKLIFSSLSQSSYIVKGIINGQTVQQSVSTSASTKSFVNLDFN